LGNLEVLENWIKGIEKFESIDDLPEFLTLILSIRREASKGKG
jgi:hypothetical protein